MHAVMCVKYYIHRTILRGTIILLPLLGLTWLFGLLTLNENATVFAWLFTIFNSLQVTTLTLTHKSCHAMCPYTQAYMGFYLLDWQGEGSPKNFYFHAKYFSFPQSGCFIPKHPIMLNL